ncbi:isopentenyl-diphosphate Delta-isomerase [Vallicoccus soli]|uniref:Isopentenyl-diphosphate Delta-isomerase n=1 Tax=Vallicoccus soli TaxID=2339232 RepID=A0A3A3Z146_9ACTN|nr:isopentenyl-diphosphate Delta-isomerase [Vallicoccus soli]
MQLLDDRGRPCGTAPKAEVHHAQTPLHLAFSCWLFDDEGRTLVSRRAWSKRTWPGVLTNSFCGHPAPGEEPAAAVERRAPQELGTRVGGVRALLPDFRYRAVMADGTVENEVCPVFSARLLGDPRPAQDEVAELRWMAMDELVAEVERDPAVWSPWMRMQLEQIRAR